MNKQTKAFAQAITGLVTGALVVLTLTACNSKPAPVTKLDEAVNFSTLEDARNQARVNAEFNAQLYRAESPRLSGFKIVTHGDSTQSNDCPQGDGWATLNFIKVEDNNTITKYTAKCSTVSQALGCYLEADFAKKPFATEENKCQPQNKVPFPLPKLGK